MENAVDALKIAFAVMVFGLALALAFSVVGQARATSDIVFQLNDKTESYEYITAEDYNITEDRIVGFETILPTIYRYQKEQYAVTIIGTDGKAIARFDLYTEGFMGDWNDVLKKIENGTEEEKASANETYNEVADRLGKVDEVISAETGIAINDSNKLINQLGHTEYGNLYRVKRNGRDSVENGNAENRYIVSAQWTGSAESEIIKRIECDLTGKEYTKNNITYQGKELLRYEGRTFKEKFVEIATSGHTVTSDNGNGDSLETVKGNKKLEIIYFLQP